MPFTRADADKEAGYPLSQAQWQVVACIRAWYEIHHRAPGARRITDSTGIPMKELVTLFPGGFPKEPCEIAGVPHPGCPS